MGIVKNNTSGCARFRSRGANKMHVAEFAPILFINKFLISLGLFVKNRRRFKKFQNDVISINKKSLGLICRLFVE